MKALATRARAEKRAHCGVMVAAAVVLVLACDRDRDASSKRAADAAATDAARETTSKKKRARDAQAKRGEDGGSDAGRSKSATSREAAAPFIVDDLADVGPAGPATATHRGVLLVTKDDDVVVARLGPLTRAPAPGATPIGAVDRPKKDFVSLGRAPAVTRDYAYWISGGRLVRRKVGSSGAAGDLETLSKDARDDTPVSAPIPTKGRTDAVAYIAVAPGDDKRLVAKLWAEGGHTAQLTPGGAAGSSVALVRTQDGLVALSLEGRSGMSPVHARTVDVAKGKIDLGEDVVAWIGGPAQPMTQLAGVASNAGAVFGLVPLEQDIAHFGLALIGVGEKLGMDAEVTWRTYPNGLDPAPVAVTYACGTPVVVYARPSAATPRSPQELHLAAIRPQGLASSIVLARSRGFSTVTVAPIDGGMLVAYVADWRTWARTVRCAPK